MNIIIMLLQQLTIKTILQKYQALIDIGFIHDNIVSISSNGGANQAITTILQKYQALIDIGFSHDNIVSISSNGGATQAIKTILENYH